ncbi:MAG: hypothetical protein ACR2JC_19245 [Chloroflexota bacterium]
MRRRLVVLSAGAVASVLPLVTLSLAPRLFGAHPLIPPEQAALAVVLLPAGFTYAILRHDVLHVPLIQRWLVQGLLWSALLVPCVGVAYVLRTLPPVGPRSPDLWITAVALLLGGAAFRWLYGWLSSVIDRLIFKDSYDYRASLQRLSAHLSLVRRPRHPGRIASGDAAPADEPGVRGAVGARGDDDPRARCRRVRQSRNVASSY